jgi:ferric iron reductase protein FhuF
MTKKRRKQIPRRPMYRPSDDIILNLAANYGINAKFINEDVLYMTTSLDGKTIWNEWYCYIYWNHLELRHQNKKNDFKHAHKHNVYWDFNYMFNSIIKHEEFTFKKII